MYESEFAAHDRIAIIGGGPAGLFVFKAILESSLTNFEIHIFEASDALGKGMPYGPAGALSEHITNVSANEIPELVTSINDWLLQAPADLLTEFNIDKNHFSEYRVLPRLLFGKYLEAQFQLLIQRAKMLGTQVKVFIKTRVTDIIDLPQSRLVAVECEHTFCNTYKSAIICSGHNWPKSHESIKPGWFDSPYPPAKLQYITNHAVAIRGSSLTAIDAVRTLARTNGSFFQSNGQLAYRLQDDCPEFRIVLHSTKGLLPAVRFHLEDPHLSATSLLSAEQIASHIKENNGFLSLDFLFEKDYKEILRKHHQPLYELIKDDTLEEFVDHVMAMREGFEAFDLFSVEYEEAKVSIAKRKSVYWKELLAILSFQINYPAKHFSAEDMLRLQKVLKPLISVIIAFVPQSSCEELLALHRAGILSLIAVGDDSTVSPHSTGGVVYGYTSEKGEKVEEFFQTYIDCVGQRALQKADLPFPSLIRDDVVSQATLRFRKRPAPHDLIALDKRLCIGRDNNPELKVDGIRISDNFNVIGADHQVNPRIYMMAVPYMGGYNPDYSGLDFCEHAATLVITDLENFINYTKRNDQSFLKAV